MAEPKIQAISNNASSTDSIGVETRSGGKKGKKKSGEDGSASDEQKKRSQGVSLDGSRLVVERIDHNTLATLDLDDKERLDMRREIRGL